MATFEDIKAEYKEVHKEFLKKKQILVQHFERGVWAPSIPKEVYKLFTKFKDKNKTFLDLGSGDGLVVMIASLFFKKALGVEWEDVFFKKSVDIQNKLEIKNVEFLKKDFFDMDFSQYDILYIAPDKEFTLKLENKIEKEMKGILMVYSSIFRPKTLEKIDEIETNYFSVGIYKNTPK